MGPKITTVPCGKHIYFQALFQLMAFWPAFSKTFE